MSAATKFRKIANKAAKENGTPPPFPEVLEYKKLEVGSYDWFLLNGFNDMTRVNSSIEADKMACIEMRHCVSNRSYYQPSQSMLAYFNRVGAALTNKEPMSARERARRWFFEDINPEEIYYLVPKLIPNTGMYVDKREALSFIKCILNYRLISQNEKYTICAYLIDQLFDLSLKNVDPMEYA